MADLQHDLVIIGSGPGGYVAAIRAGQLGLNVCVVEKDAALGGTCLQRGCIPTKALLHTADLLQHAREGAKFGVVCGEVKLDMKAAHDHKRRVVTKNSKGVEFLFRKNKVTWLQGTGRVVKPGLVEVTKADGTKVTIECKHLVLATGSRCGELPHLAPDGDRILNSDHILELAEVPPRLVVLGAGAVGMEFASIFARFGSKVTVIELLDRVLPLEDAEVSAEVEKAFRKQGIAVHTGTRVEEAKVDGQVVRCRAVNGKGETVEVEADRLLVAVGRVAVFKGIGLENTKVQIERGRIVVDEYCRTHEPGIYAIGDLIATPWLAHVASMEGIIAVEHLAGRDPRPINPLRIPSCTYCYPGGGLDRPHRRAGQGEGLRRQDRHVPLLRHRQGGDHGRVGRLREDRRRRQVRRDPGRAHRGPPRHRAAGRGRGGAGRRADGGGAHPHHPRPSDAPRGDPRGGGGRARRRDSHVGGRRTEGEREEGRVPLPPGKEGKLLLFFTLPSPSPLSPWGNGRR